jgi:ribosomal protein S18 acetylase RimI-like enzyme
MEVKIRRVTRFSKKVYNSVLHLLPQLDQAYPLPSAEHFRSVLRNPNNHFIIAEHGNKEIVGIMTLVTYSIPTGTKYWIEDVVVDESSRGKGIGKMLVIHAVDNAKSMGAKSVDLTSRPFRIAANQLYHRLGFELRETNLYRYLIR